MKSLIAEVAVPVSICLYRTFDYTIPKELSDALERGQRVLVPFGTSTRLGYCVAIKKSSPFKRLLKPVSKILDPAPLINKELFDLARKVSEDYFCSMAEALHLIIPKGILRTQELAPVSMPQLEVSEVEKEIIGRKVFACPRVLIQDVSRQKIWTIYGAWIKKTLNEGRSVIILVPDHRKIDAALKYLALPLEPFTLSSRLKQKNHLSHWSSIARADHCFVMGTRSAVFAPAKNLGLLIIDEEEHFAYRQDAFPYYHARDIAFLRAKEGALKVLLGSCMPSLETYAAFKSKDSGFLYLGAADDPADVKVVGFSASSRVRVVSRVLEYRIADFLEKKGKILVFCSQKGFSTFLFCPRCKKVQSCPRCSRSLVYFQREKKVRCPVCGDQRPAYELCPECKTAYIRYAGFGMEKIASELARLYPSAKITFREKAQNDAGGYDIMLATPQILEDVSCSGRAFDAVAVLSVDQMMAHADFRDIEKTFAKLMKLGSLAKKELILQTRNPDHYIFDFIARHDTQGFYKQELAQRRELQLPPATGLGVFLVRSPRVARAAACAKKICFRLKNLKRRRPGIEVLGPVAATPFKIRNNYRYQVFLKYKNKETIKKTVRAILTGRPGGAIITFDPAAL